MAHALSRRFDSMRHGERRRGLNDGDTVEIEFEGIGVLQNLGVARRKMSRLIWCGWTIRVIDGHEQSGLGDRKLRGRDARHGQHCRPSPARHGKRSQYTNRCAGESHARTCRSHSGQQFGIGDAHVYADYQTLLDEEPVDFVDIATAPHIHREQVLAAAAQGVHVLCQKPFATSLPEALEMIRACEAAGVRCIVNENWRWRRWYRELKQLLCAGNDRQHRVMRVFLCTPMVYCRVPMARCPGFWFTSPIRPTWSISFCTSGASIWSDVLRYLFGSIARVYANTSRTSPLVRGEDHALDRFGISQRRHGHSRYQLGQSRSRK